MGEGQLVLRVYPVRPGHEGFPMLLQDLNASKTPAEALLLQAFEVNWHQAAAKGAIDVKRLIAFFQNTQAGFSIFGNTPFVPAADLFQYRLADQAHRPGKDDGIAFITRGHGDFKKILVEGGGEINWSVLKLGLADELIVTISPVVIGGRDAKTLVEGEGIANITNGIKMKLSKTVIQNKNEIVLYYKLR